MKLAAYATVMVGGLDLRQIVDQDTDVLEVVIEDHYQAADMVTVKLNNSRLVYVDRFKAGAAVTASIGYVGETARAVFEGALDAIEPEYPETGTPTVILRAYDLSFAMRQDQKTRSWQNVKDSQLAARIGAEYGLQVVADDSGTLHEYVSQENETDMAFLQRRAALIGFECTVHGKTLYFRRPRREGEPVRLHYRSPEATLLSFSPRLAVSQANKAVYVRSWDPVHKRVIVAKSTAASDGGVKALVRAAIRSQKAADQAAKAQNEEVNVWYKSGSGSCVGDPLVKAGALLDIQGVDQTFAGTYYATLSRHTFNEKGYLTEFEARSRVVLGDE